MVIKPKTREEIAQVFADKGQESFPIKVSIQSVRLLEKLNWTEEDWTKFVNWWVENYTIVGGSHILKFIEERAE